MSAIRVLSLAQWTSTVWTFLLASLKRTGQSPLAQNEADIIARARNMDPDAWDIIFNRYYPEIFSYLRYRTNSLEDAEDLAAMVFERAVRHIGSYKETGRGMGAWLQRIASNLVVDYYRRRSVKARVSEPLPPNLVDTHPSPLEHALRRDTVEDIHKALAELPDSQRDVLIYRFLLGYNLEETAQIMDKSVNAIKALQHRALKRLRQVWKREIDDDAE